MKSAIFHIALLFQIMVRMYMFLWGLSTTLVGLGQLLRICIHRTACICVQVTHER